MSAAPEAGLSMTSGVILGIIEGLTEFIPVSSTGHLILAGHWLHFTGEVADSFEIFIQLGAILAVVVLYFSRFTGLLDFSQKGYRDNSFRGISGLVKIGVACLPAFICGALFHGPIKRALFHPTPVAMALVTGGIILIAIERRRPQPRTEMLDGITVKQSFLIGLAQCFSLWPGISRSGSTIVGGMLVGLERSVAAEFSFLVAVPVMAAAVAFDLLKSMDQLSTAHIGLFAAGFVTSFVAALIAIKFFIRLLHRWTLAPFGVYRVIVGALILLLG